MILGTITVPQKIITGAFTILFSFQRPIIFSMADIDVETLSGDALGHGKDVFGGDGANYYVQCYLPDMRAGESRISVKKSGVSVASVVVGYDTRKVVFLTWGTPFQEGNRLEVPVSLDVPLRILKKKNFRLLPPVPFQLYGSGNVYRLVLPVREVEIAIQGAVVKANGVDAEIKGSVLEVNGGTLN